MAELTNACCTPVAQETCCEPSDKASCCGESHADGCGCSAGSVHASTTTATVTVEDVRETVRQKYAAAAVAAASGAACCGPADDAGLFGASLYSDSSAGDAPEAAINASLAVASPPPSPTCARARPSSISGRAPAPTS